MTQKTKNIVKSLLSVAIAAVLLYFCFRGVSWTDFVAGLSGCRWSFVILSIIAGAGAFLFRGLRWHKLLKPLDPSVSRLSTYNAVCIGNISNFVLPYLSEVVRCGIVLRRAHKEDESERKLGVDNVIGTMALERVLDIFSIALLLALLLVFKWSDFGAFFSEKVFSGRSGAFALAVALAGLLGLAAIALATVFRNKSRVAEKIFGFIKGLWDGFTSCMRMEGKWLFIAYTALIWGLYWLQIVFAIEALPEVSSLGLTDALFIMLAGSVASLAPVPGGFGAFHYVVALALSSIYGFSWETGIVFATIAHETQAVAMILTGGASYISETTRKN